MPEERRLRLLVLSDMHAYCGAARDKAPSSIQITGRDPEDVDVFNGCLVALKASGVEQVDAVLCAGDMTDEADPEALERVWAFLNQVASALGARLIATTGNHDVDSRGRRGVDPRESLLDLQPLFPTGTEPGQQHYFTHHFCLDEIGETPILVLNSSAHHGMVHEVVTQDGTPWNEHEYNHGRVTRATIAKISAALDAQTADRTSVMLTHHHPIQLPGSDASELSQMVDGAELLNALARHGQWLVIHGHKHRPFIHYAPGGGGSPVIVSVGSMGATMDGEYEQAVENQIYLIELLSPSEADALHLGVAGTVRAWTREPWGRPAWREAAPQDALPALNGFGWRENPATVSRGIADWLGRQGGSATIQEVEQEFPALPYLIPSDLELTISHLERNRGCMVVRDTGGQVVRIELNLDGRREGA